MQCRTLLNTMLGLSSLLAWPIKSKAADARSSAAEAIRSADPEVVITFIKADAARAGRATAQEKAEMLSIIASPKNGAYARTGLRGRGEAENAALILLRSAERNPDEMTAIVGALGGSGWIQQQVPTVENPELKRLASQAVSGR